MHFLPVKPVSTNSMYAGSGIRKWRSSLYMSFEKEVKDYLKNIPIRLPEGGGIEFKGTFGVSYRFDLDNTLKPFIDILERFYKFEDNRICKIDARKIITKRGSEFIEFDLKATDQHKVQSQIDASFKKAFTDHFGYPPDKNNPEHEYERSIWSEKQMFSDEYYKDNPYV